MLESRFRARISSSGFCALIRATLMKHGLRPSPLTILPTPWPRKSQPAPRATDRGRPAPRARALLGLPLAYHVAGRDPGRRPGHRRAQPDRRQARPRATTGRDRRAGLRALVLAAAQALHGRAAGASSSAAGAVAAGFASGCR